MTLAVAETPSRAVLLAALAFVTACGSVKPQEPEWPPRARQWYDLAEKAYHVADIEEAELAIENAQRLLPDEPEVRVLASRVALAQLEYDRCIELLEGLPSSEARGLRGRAYWYSGATEQAADELDELLTDPSVKDPWAREIAKLARLGAGREPFAMSGGILAATDMPKTGTAALVVPVEVNGEPALGMIATGVPEVVLDSSAGAKASWISLRFGDRVEVRDVPAIAKDLTGLSRRVNAPIKVLLGVNLLRHLNATFDFAGGQFVVRNFEAPPPPYATSMRLDYLHGGGMVIRSALGREEGAPVASLMVDTGMLMPLALDDGGWEKAGISVGKLTPVEGMPGYKQGTLPLMHLGAYELPSVPGILDESVQSFEESLGVDLDGTVGAGLLAFYRVTLTADARSMWLEDMPAGAMGEEPPTDTALPPSAPTDSVPHDAPEPTMPGAPGLAPLQLTPPQP